MPSPDAVFTTTALLAGKCLTLFDHLGFVGTYLSIKTIAGEASVADMAAAVASPIRRSSVRVFGEGGSIIIAVEIAVEPVFASTLSRDKMYHNTLGFSLSRH